MIELLHDQVLVNPELVETKTAGGIIIPESAANKQSAIRYGVVAKKGNGTPYNDMPDVHVKQRVAFRNGAGKPYEEETEDGHIAKFLIIKYEDLLLI